MPLCDPCGPALNVPLPALLVVSQETIKGKIIANSLLP